MVGLTVAQISEFSLIMLAMGSTLGHVSQSHVSLVVLVGIITMTGSTYLILASEKLYKFFMPYLSYFERRNPKEHAYVKEMAFNNHIVLIGCDRTGRSLVDYFKKHNLSFLVIDFNPKVYARLTADNVSVIFGDVNDHEILEAAHIESASTVISTVGNYPDNLALLLYIQSHYHRPMSIFTSSGKKEALRLYEAGATYVLVPEVIAGDYIKNLLKIHGHNKHKLEIAGKHHFDKILSI